MNPDLAHLQPYPFEKLATLKQGIEPPTDLKHIALSIGEPKHPTPSLITETIAVHLGEIAVYPTTRGLDELRETISAWLHQRFSLAATPDPATQILPVNGTREALFALAQATIDRTRDALVLMPNPFYQIYEGAALLSGGQPVYLPCAAEHGFIPDFDAVSTDTWQRCQLLYLCSPGNPTGAVIPIETLQRLIGLAERHDFIIASDECYSEIYRDEDAPPPGLMQAAARMGLDDYRRCVVFHSLSKRSNAPGLRSGFVAGDAALLGQFLGYRTYHGCAMPLHHQRASIAAWGDESHVVDNRRQYRAKFDAVARELGPALPVRIPSAGFYLWAATPEPETEFARGLFARQNLTVLPGSYLSRQVDEHNPGAGYVRMALVAPLDECITAARRIRRYIEESGNSQISTWS